MTDALILREIETIVREVLDQPTISLTAETSPLEFDDWDSIAQIQIILGIEERFGIKMALAETQEWTTIQSVIESVQRSSVR